MKRILQRLDSTHQKLLNTVSPLSPEVYSRQPAANEWSVGEIVHHVRLVEDRVITELENAAAQSPRRVALLRRLIPTAIVSSRLIRVKSPKAVTPLDAPAKEAGLENLDRARSRLKDFCATHGNERLRNLVFKHPFLGEIDGVAAVSFLGYHEQRHYKQIQEVLKRLAADSH
jgi:DinB family protein